jgi:hypothetical protein
MKSRKAEVVCPLFFTKEQANTAMLKRLVEDELKAFDVKAYAFGADAGVDQLRALFQTVKATVKAHDVVLVRSFEREGPYFGEAWFYGRTQKSGDQVVIRGVVDEKNARVEFYAASGSIRAVTGLLAEFHRTFEDSPGADLEALALRPLFDEAVRRTYSDARMVASLLDRGNGALA